MLDRILVSTEWEQKHPLCFAWSKTRVGSDHWPIFLDSGANSEKRQKPFYFEKHWLLEEGFVQMVVDNWKTIRSRFSEQRYSMDIWHGCLSLTRQRLRGWSANKLSKSKKTKNLISKELDTLGETREEDTSLWAWRYQLEGKLEEIYNKEEIFWQQRGNEKWLLKGDANTGFFHKCANGRRRKTKICSLDTDQGVISEHVELKICGGLL
jgi:hypothetical protein